MEAEFDRYSGWMRCGVITIHSPRPLWLTNTLHSDRQIWLPQKLGRSMPHIQSAWERGIWGCGTEGTISTWAHYSRHPPSIYPSNPPTMCLLPTTHNQVTKENHTHVLKHTLTVSRADLKAGAETLESNGSFYKIFLHYVFIPITHISATSVIHTTALHIFTICISLKWKWNMR